MQKITIQELRTNLQVILAIDTNLFVDMVVDVLNSDTSKAYFQQLENKVLDSMEGLELDVQKEQEISILFVLNDLLQNNTPIVEEGSLSYGSPKSMDVDLIFMELWQAAKTHYKIEHKKVSTIEIKELRNTTIIKENLELLAQSDFESFLNVVNQVFFAEKYDFLNTRDNLKYGILFCVIQINLRGDLLEKGLINKNLESFYLEIETWLQKMDVNLKKVYVSRIVLLEKKEREKKLDISLKNSFQKYDVVYKALS